MAADAGVALEDDVAALVDGEAVVLVVDGAAQSTVASADVHMRAVTVEAGQLACPRW